MIEFPAHTTKDEAEMLIDGVTDGFTIMFTVLEDAEAGLAHNAELVNTQETASALFKVELTNEDALAPLTLVPLIFH